MKRKKHRNEDEEEEGSTYIKIINSKSSRKEIRVQRGMIHVFWWTIFGHYVGK